MVVWINNPFDFLPGEGARLQRYGLLSRELVRAGHRVMWWSSDWNHLKKTRRSYPLAEYKSSDACAWLNEVEIKLIPTLAYFRNIGICRLMSHWRYAHDWERMACTYVTQHPQQKPDLIICSLPPLDTLSVMQRLSKRFNCRSSIDIMDAWPEVFERVLPRWMLWPFRQMVRRAYRSVDGISSVGETYQRVAQTYLGTMHKPSWVCYHGVDLINRKGERAKKDKAVLRLLYIGNMSAAYDLTTVVRAVAKLHQAGYPVYFDLAGEGPACSQLKQLVHTLHAEAAICFHGVLVGIAFDTVMQSADVGIIPMFPQTWVAVPYKLADYANYGIPVLNCLSGETQSLIERYEAGWYYNSTHVEGLENILLLLLNNKERIDTAGQQIRRMAEELFDANVIYPKFVRWLEGENA